MRPTGCPRLGGTPQGRPARERSTTPVATRPCAHIGKTASDGKPADRQRVRPTRGARRRKRLMGQRRPGVAGSNPPATWQRRPGAEVSPQAGGSALSALSEAPPCPLPRKPSPPPSRCLQPGDSQRESSTTPMLVLGRAFRAHGFAGLGNPRRCRGLTWGCPRPGPPTPDGTFSRFALPRVGIVSSASGGRLRRPGTLIACGPVNGEYTTEAAWRSAEIHSLRITARRAGLDPANWLEDVLRRIPTATTANLHEPLPSNGKPAMD